MVKYNYVLITSKVKLVHKNRGGGLPGVVGGLYGKVRVVVASCDGTYHNVCMCRYSR